MIKLLRNWFRFEMEANVISMKNKRKSSPDLIASKSNKPTKKPRFVDKYDGTYYFDLRNGLRMVYPYDYEYRASVKRRWVDTPILEVYKKEFRAYEIERVARKFAIGEILVNDEKVQTDYVLKDGDVIISKVHRHENPVLATSIRIVHEDDQLLVLNKPSSIPVHPCGKYRLNSVLALLYKELGHQEVHIVHRLDRLTSGLLIMAKTSETAKKISQEIGGRTVSKEYVCKVDGVFPEGRVTCGQPIDRLCHKLGVHFVAPEGKPSFTEFRRLATDGQNSIVHCRPRTGRTHQIRIHLQYLGYPIVNDPLYNSTAFGSTRGKEANYEVNSREELIQRIYAAHPLDKWVDSEIELTHPHPPTTVSESESNHVQIGRESEMRAAVRTSKQISPDDVNELIETLRQVEVLELKNNPEMCDRIRSNLFDCGKMSVNSDCPDCQLLFKPPTVEQMYICLHALRYTSSEWSFFADPPSWARMDSSIDFKCLSSTNLQQ